jgi:hypothetical protein
MPMRKKKQSKKKPPKKKVKRQSKPKGLQSKVQPEPGVLNEGAPFVPQSTTPTLSPGEVGHWNHEHDEELG